MGGMTDDAKKKSEYLLRRNIGMTTELEDLWQRAKAEYEAATGTSLTFQRHAAMWIERGCKEALREAKRREQK